MLATLVFQTDAFELKLSADFSGSISGSGRLSDGSAWVPNEMLGYEVTGTTRYWNGFGLVAGLEFSVASERAQDHMPSTSTVTSSYVATLSGIGSPVTVSGSSWQPALSASVVFNNLRIYQVPADASWLVKWDGATLNCAGTTSSVGAGSAAGVAGNLSAAAIPLLGVPMKMGGSMTASINPGGSIPGWVYEGEGVSIGDDAGIPFSKYRLNYLYDIVADCIVGGGYRWKLPDGTWYAPPTVAPSFPAVSAGGPYNLNTSGIVLSTSTYGNQIKLRFRQSEDIDQKSATFGGGGTPGSPNDPSLRPYWGWKAEDNIESSYGFLMPIPNLPISVRRLNSDYSALVQRAGVPRRYSRRVGAWTAFDGVKGYASGGWSTIISGSDTSGPPQDDHNDLRVARSQFLERVTNATGSVEDGLGEPIYSLVEVTTSRIANAVNQVSATGLRATVVAGNENAALTCHVAAATEQTEPAFGEADHLRTDVTDSDWVNFQSSIRAAHWLWFPLNLGDEDPVSSYEWQVQGARANSDAYWTRLGHQWMENPDLPTAQRTKRRNTILAEQVGESPFGGYLQTAFFPNCARSSWWAIDNYIRLDLPQSPTEIQVSTASSGLFSISPTTCTFTVSSNITVNTGGAASCDLIMDAGSFSIQPYMFGHISNWIQVNTVSNVASVEVFFRDVAGSDAAAVVEAGGWFKRPLNPDASNFAGSWAVEKNQGVTSISDEGVDKNPPTGGVSSATMSDAERAFAFGLNRGRTCKSVVIRLTPTNAAASMVINRPTWKRDAAHPSVVLENVQVQDLLWANGPGVRWGCLKWVDMDTGAVLSEPEVLPPGTVSPDGSKPGIADALISKAVIFEGKSPTDPSILTLAKALFDSTERGTDDTLVFKRLNEGTRSFVWGPHLYLVASAVPCGLFGSYPRDVNLDPIEPTSNAADSLCMGPRFLVSPNIQSHIRKVGDPALDSMYSAPSGWKLSKYDPEVLNTETTSGYEVYVGTTAIANATPWHGYFLVPDADNEAAAGGVSTDWHRDGRFWRACVEGGKACIERRGPNTPYQVLNMTEDADGVAIRVEKHNAKPLIWVWITDAGALKEFYSTDSGVTLTMATTISSSNNPRYPMPEVETDGVRYLYWVEDGSPATIKGLIRDKAGNTLFSGNVLTGVDDSPGSVRLSIQAGGMVKIYLQARVGGSLVEYSSSDGRTFT